MEATAKEVEPQPRDYIIALTMSAEEATKFSTWLWDEVLDSGAEVDIDAPPVVHDVYWSLMDALEEMP